MLCTKEIEVGLFLLKIQTSKEKPVALSHPILRLRHNQTNKILSQNAFHCNNLQDWFSCGIWKWKPAFVILTTHKNQPLRFWQLFFNCNSCHLFQKTTIINFCITRTYQYLCLQVKRVSLIIGKSWHKNYSADWDPAVIYYVKLLMKAIIYTKQRHLTVLSSTVWNAFSLLFISSSTSPNFFPENLPQGPSSFIRVLCTRNQLGTHSA